MSNDPDYTTAETEPISMQITRRFVLQKSAIATGAVVGGTAVSGNVAGQDDDVDENDTCELPECIHPVAGYIGYEDDPPADLAPDHEIELVTEQPELADEEDNDGRPPIPEFYFEPTGLAVDAGDVVQFTLASPDHTVTAYHPDLGHQRRVPEDVPGFSSPVLPAESFWLYRFDEPGVYDLLCSPHEIFGKVMRIVVDEPTEDFGDEEYPERRGPQLTAALVLNDEALDPERIQEDWTVSWDDIDDENKRLLVQFEEPPHPDEEGEEEVEDEDRLYVDEVDEQVPLAYGETAYLSNSIQITAHGFEFDTSLGQFVEADEGMHYALLRLTGENTGDTAERLPRPWSDFSVLYNGNQTDADSGIGIDDYDAFEGGEVQPGVTREGFVTFEVPDDLDQTDLDTIWFDDLFGRSIDVRWTDG